MNNRVQQRFDRSIREAVAETKRIREAESAARLEKARALRARKVAAIDRMLATGMGNGEPITEDDRQRLMDYRTDLMRGTREND